MLADVLESTASGAELPTDLNACPAWIRDLMEIVIRRVITMAAQRKIRKEI